MLMMHAHKKQKAPGGGRTARSEVCACETIRSNTVYLRAPACHSRRLWFLIHIPPLVLFHTRMSSSALPIGFFQFFSKSAVTCGRQGAKGATFGDEADGTATCTCMLPLRPARAAGGAPPAARRAAQTRRHASQPARVASCGSPQSALSILTC